MDAAKMEKEKIVPPSKDDVNRDKWKGTITSPTVKVISGERKESAQYKQHEPVQRVSGSRG
jgi:hypothetical protein